MNFGIPPFPHRPLPLASGQHVKKQLIKPAASQLRTLHALSVRCCSCSADKDRKKRVPGSQVINIAGDVIINVGEGKVQLPTSPTALVCQPVSWDAVAMSPEAKALLKKHAVKASTALKLQKILGFEDVHDVQHLNSDLLAQLKLKPLQLQPLLNMLRDWRLDPADMKEEQPLGVEGSKQGQQAQQQATPSQGQALSIWHLDTGTCIATLQAQGSSQAEFAVSILPEWRGVVTARRKRVDCARQAALSWMDTVEGRCGEEHCVEVRPHRGYAVSGHMNHMLHVWDVSDARSGSCIASFEFQ